jgi:anaerobic ribonucleoside-triphosphate reductase
MWKGGNEMKDEERTLCEVWTRVMGYFRPVSGYNKGKQSEFRERKYFKESSAKYRQNKEKEKISA